MKFKTAIYERITELSHLSGLTLSQLAIKSVMTPSTLYQIKTNDTNLSSLLSVKRICHGLNITFFDVDYINTSDFE